MSDTHQSAVCPPLLVISLDKENWQAQRPLDVRLHEGPCHIEGEPMFAGSIEDLINQCVNFTVLVRTVLDHHLTPSTFWCGTRVDQLNTEIKSRIANDPIAQRKTFLEKQRDAIDKELQQLYYGKEQVKHE